MSQHKGWVEVLKPWLEAKRDQSFPDPQSFTKEEDFTYAAKITSIYKKVIQEIINEIDQKITEAKYFRQKEESGGVDPFAIGQEEKVE